MTQVYDSEKITPSELAEHVGLEKQILQDGIPFVFRRYAGPYHTEYGTSWMFGGEAKGGKKFTCFLPDNKSREEQLQKLVQNKHYLLVKESWKGFDDVIMSFYKFKAIKGF